MGFPVIAAGLHSTPSSDLGIVFENQLLMLFRQSDAQAVASEIVQTHKDLDQTLLRRKKLQKERQSVNRDLKELNDLIRRAKPKAKPVLSRQIDEAELKIEELTEALEDLEGAYRLSKSRERVIANTANSDEHVLVNFVSPIVDAVNAKKGTQYTMLTARPLRGIMRDADVIAVWLMEKGAVNLLLKHSQTDLRLKEWFLPWAKDV